MFANRMSANVNRMEATEWIVCMDYMTSRVTLRQNEYNLCFNIITEKSLGLKRVKKQTFLVSRNFDNSH